MKALIPISILLLVLSSCGKDQLKKEQARNAELVSQNITSRARLDQYAAYVRGVEKDLRTIRERQESLVELLELPSEVKGGDPIPVHLEAIGEMLEESRFKLSSMREELRSESRKLQAQTSENKLLRQRNEEKTLVLDSLEHRLTEGTIALEIMHLQQAKLVEQLHEMEDRQHQAWYAFGSWDELESQSIAEKQGGWLGIGGRKVLSPDFTAEYFTAVDTRELSCIPLLCNQAKLLSSHPRDSYRWNGEESVESIEILDPERFWQHTRYLAIEVKQ